DTSASIARSNWLSLRRCRHSRISEPNAGACTSMVVTASVSRTAAARTTTSEVIAPLTCKEDRRGVERTAEERDHADHPVRPPADSEVVALRADLRPGRLIVVHRHGLLLRPGARGALTVAGRHARAVGGHRPVRSVARPAGHRDGDRPGVGDAVEHRDTGGVLALVGELSGGLTAAGVVDLPVLDAVEPARP